MRQDVKNGTPCAPALIDSAECHSRIDSLRMEVQRLENESNRIEHLLDVLTSEKSSPIKLLRLAWLTLAVLLPDVLKWLLRPLVRVLRRGARMLEGGPSVEAYQVKSNSPLMHERMRVLHVIANFSLGGSSRLVVDLLEGLGGRYRQEILTRYSPVPTAYQGAVIRERHSLFEITSLIRQFRPHLIHFHYWGDVDFAWYDKVFMVAEKLSCKIVENVNTPVMPYNSATVMRYVFVSDYVRRTFGGGFNPQQVIYPGSNLAMFRCKVGQHHQAGCIGMVYRLEPDKLNDQSIDPLIKVVRRCPGTRVMIVGDGSLKQPFEDKVRTFGVTEAFEFTGAVPYVNLPDLFSRMTLFVAPVWKESFGQVSCFAMSMGIPVVGYRVGGIEEIVGNPELLADAGDSQQLADIIVALLNNPQKWQAVSKYNQQRAHELFSVESMVAQYAHLYREILG